MSRHPKPLERRISQCLTRGLRCRLRPPKGSPNLGLAASLPVPQPLTGQKASGAAVFPKWVATSEELCLPPINQNVLGALVYVLRLAEKIIFASLVGNINQADFIVVRIAIVVYPSQNGLIRIPCCQP